MDNIEKLKEKVAKDPTSKLFVPLAEEYKKAGMLDKAIGVLKDGLAKQPAYMSARVSLGKIFLEASMMSEAKDEFEKVIKAIPDNLFARRKLADIYKALGEKENALEQYKTVLKLNPFDEDALIIVQGLEGKATAAPVLDAAPGEALAEAPPFEFPPEETPAEELTADEIATGESPAFEVSEGAFEIKAEDFPEGGFAEDLNGETLQFGTAFEQEAKALSAGAEEEAHIEIGDEEITIEDVEALVAESPEAFEGLAGGFVLPEEAAEEVLEVEAIDETEEALPVEEAFEAEAVEIIEEAVPEEEAVSIAEEVVESPVVEEIVEAGEAVPVETGQAVEELSVSVEEALEEETDDLSLADLYVSQGKYFDAMSVYRAALNKNPEDRGVMQRAMELKLLIRLLGKEKELIEANLLSFLEGIKRRRNEFFRST